MIAVYKYPARNTWNRLLERPVIDHNRLSSQVRLIMDDVKNHGDAAVKKYSLQFDKVELNSFAVSDEEWKEADQSIGEAVKSSISTAINNIRKFHESQKEEIKIIETTAGVQCWRRSVAIEKVGLYIPGGTAPLFSTLLMLAVPATIAGCKEIIVCTAAGTNGKIHPAILFAAKTTGIKNIFKIGGVQAIAAMGYGTESIPQVYKIFGPGNQYVTCAKTLLNAEGIAIDMPAGPSELAVLADKSADPSYIAADLLSQAEHGADSQVLLVSDEEKIIKEVQQQLSLQLEKLSRREFAAKALLNSKAILVHNLEEGMDLLNEYAPEHLVICSNNVEALANTVINAGSVFLGNYSPESAGDYASGTNHTLPTHGAAKAYSGVSLDSFVKKITFQKASKEGLRHLSNTIITMANAEGMQAHAEAVSIRLKD
jgi:histidinol dehydrogenase